MTTGSVANCAIILTIALLCASANGQVAQATQTYTLPAITGIVYSIPANVYVSALSNGSTNTYVTITGDAPLVNAASFSAVAGGNLTANLSQSQPYQQGLQATVTILVHNFTLKYYSSPGAQTGANGNATISGLTLDSSGPLPISVFSSGGSLVSLVQADTGRLILQAASRSPLSQPLLNITGTLGAVNYTGGPGTSAYLTGIVGPVGVTMYQGSSLNISSAVLPAIDNFPPPTITGNYTLEGGTGNTAPGYIYYNNGTCNVSVIGTGQATACMQV